MGGLPITNCRLEAVAIVFHWECPVIPHRSTSLDTVSNME